MKLFTRGGDVPSKPKYVMLQPDEAVVPVESWVHSLWRTRRKGTVVYLTKPEIARLRAECIGYMRWPVLNSGGPRLFGSYIIEVPEELLAPKDTND